MSENSPLLKNVDIDYHKTNLINEKSQAQSNHKVRAR